jgi:hypothetical protein
MALDKLEEGDRVKEHARLEIAMRSSSLWLLGPQEQRGTLQTLQTGTVTSGDDFGAKTYGVHIRRLAQPSL